MESNQLRQLCLLSSALSKPPESLRTCDRPAALPLLRRTDDGSEYVRSCLGLRENKPLKRKDGVDGEAEGLAGLLGPVEKAMCDWGESAPDLGPVGDVEVSKKESRCGLPSAEGARACVRVASPAVAPAFASAPSALRLPTFSFEEENV